MREEDFRPGIVREEKLSRQARILLCKSKVGVIRNRQRLNLEDAIELGEHLIELKKTSKRGEWLPTLDQIGVSKSTAYESMQFAKCSAGGSLDDCANRAQARQALKLEPKEEEEVIADDQAEQTTFTEEQTGTSTTEANGQEEKKPKPEETIFCESCLRCQRVGQRTPKRCPYCKEKRAEAKAAAAKAEAEAQQKADEANPWKALNKRKPRFTGGHCVRSIGVHLRATLRHVDNMLADFGLFDKETEKVVDTPATAEFKQTVIEASHKLKAERDRLKAQAQHEQNSG